MVSWDDYAFAYGTDKASAGHGYMAAYERFIADDPRMPPVGDVLEVGVDRGHSLRAWARIFPGANIVGIDNRPECAGVLTEYDEVRISILIGDATSADDMERILGDQRFDLIVDDGSHQLADALATAGLLLPRLRPGGVYAVEDLTAGSETAASMLHRLAARDDCEEAWISRSLQGWASLILFRKSGS